MLLNKLASGRQTYMNKHHKHRGKHTDMPTTRALHATRHQPACRMIDCQARSRCRVRARARVMGASRRVMGARGLRRVLTWHDRVNCHERRVPRGFVAAWCTYVWQHGARICGRECS